MSVINSNLWLIWLLWHHAMFHSNLNVICLYHYVV